MIPVTLRKPRFQPHPFRTPSDSKSKVNGVVYICSALGKTRVGNKSRECYLDLGISNGPSWNVHERVGTNE